MAVLADAIEEEVGEGAILAVDIAVGPYQLAFQALVLNIVVFGVCNHGEFPGFCIEDELVDIGVVVEGGEDRDSDAGTSGAVKPCYSVEDGLFFEVGVGWEGG